MAKFRKGINLRSLLKNTSMVIDNFENIRFLVDLGFHKIDFLVKELFPVPQDSSGKGNVQSETWQGADNDGSQINVKKLTSVF